MRCPVCNTHTTTIREELHPRTWAGRYWCQGCHTILSACGSIVQGDRIMRTWTPGCPDNGMHVVVRPNGPGVDFFRCVDCGREFERVGDRIENRDRWEMWRQDELAGASEGG